MAELLDLFLFCCPSCQAEKYGDRRGAAFGIAGAVKGLGIASLKVKALQTALSLSLPSCQPLP